eukprot:5800012-Pleurochrysis_carterae.AAC.3
MPASPSTYDLCCRPLGSAAPLSAAGPCVVLRWTTHREAFCGAIWWGDLVERFGGMNGLRARALAALRRWCRTLATRRRYFTRRNALLGRGSRWDWRVWAWGIDLLRGEN